LFLTALRLQSRGYGLESHNGEVLDEPPLDLLKAKVVAVELRAGFLEEEAVHEDVEGSGGVRRRLGPREGRGPFELKGLGLTHAQTKRKRKVTDDTVGCEGWSDDGRRMSLLRRSWEYFF